jgi:membrane-associated phospholipid phosphatase
VDIQLLRAINGGWKSSFNDVLFGALTYSALGQVAALVVLTCAVYKPWRMYAAPIAATVFISALILTHTFKSAIPRDRPSTMNTTMAMEDHRSGSFPSGHTATAFAIATSASLVGFRRRNWRILAISMPWAMGVGLSRIYRGVHWPSDVLAGALLSIATACLVEAFFKDRELGSSRRERVEKLPQ